MKYHIPLRKIYLRTISEELIIINVFKFWEISFQHVFREMNEIANNLSKVGILMGDGEWKKWECQNDTIMENDPGSIFV